MSSPRPISLPNRSFERSELAAPLFLALITLALLIAAVAGDPLSWDGGSYLFSILDQQRWYLPMHRLINAPLEAPVLIASHFTNNLAVLRLIFSLCWVSPPAVGIYFAWLVCREQRPALFIWPALSLGLMALPGMPNFVSEAKMTATLSWPLLLAALLPVRRKLLPALAALAIVLRFTHPTAASFFALSAVVAAITAARSAGEERLVKFGLSALMGLLCVSRLLAPLVPYERETLAWSSLHWSFVQLIEGWPLAMLAFSFLAALRCLLRRTLRRSASPSAATAPPIDYLLIAAVSIAGLCLVPWSLNARLWWKALNYKFWLIGFVLILMAACVLDARLPADADFQWRVRQPALPVIGASFLVVLALQSAVWMGMTRRLLTELAAAPNRCVQRESIRWIRGTALDHWATDAYAIVIQGQKPDALILTGDGCTLLAATHTLHILNDSRTAGWFDLSNVPGGG